jgi:N-formylglutamate amidohydrolase
VDINRPPNAEKFGNYRRSLVYSTNTWDEEIYSIPPNDEDIERRIKRYYEPFHSELETLITKKVKEFGKVYLIDLHSFMGPITEDVCLGNRHNVTCSKEFLEKVYGAFEEEGFETVKNKVFIGGYITKSYAVENVVEALQIELRYTNYIEPQDLDVRQVPRKETNLFQETAFRLESVFTKVGIEKMEASKIEDIAKEKNIWNNKFIWFLTLTVALFLSLIEK